MPDLRTAMRVLVMLVVAPFWLPASANEQIALFKYHGDQALFDEFSGLLQQKIENLRSQVLGGIQVTDAVSDLLAGGLPWGRHPAYAA